MLYLVVFSAVVALASACCPPKQYEAMAGLAMGTFNKVTHKSQYIEGLLQLSMDYTNKVIGETQTLVVDGVTFMQYMVLDYNQGVAFIERNGTCDKYKLGPMQDSCFPEENSETMNYGLGKNFVNARGYRRATNESTAYFSVTADSCMPIAVDIVIDSADTYAVEFMSYSNITMGIKSRQVFNVPTVCAQAGPIKPEIPLLNLGRRSVIM